MRFLLKSSYDDHVTITLICLGLLAFCVAAFTPRFSLVKGTSLRVRTWLFTFRFDLTRALAAEPVSSDEFSRLRTVRIFGIGWPLKPTGWFFSSGLGLYLNLANRPANLYLIRFRHTRVLVSLPEAGALGAVTHLPLAR